MTSQPDVTFPGLGGKGLQLPACCGDTGHHAGVRAAGHTPLSTLLLFRWVADPWGCDKSLLGHDGSAVARPACLLTSCMSPAGPWRAWSICAAPGCARLGSGTVAGLAVGMAGAVAGFGLTWRCAVVPARGSSSPGPGFVAAHCWGRLCQQILSGADGAEVVKDDKDDVSSRMHVRGNKWHCPSVGPGPWDVSAGRNGQVSSARTLITGISVSPICRIIALWMSLHADTFPQPS